MTIGSEEQSFAAHLSDVEVLWNERPDNEAFIDLEVHDGTRPAELSTKVTVLGMTLEDAKKLVAMLNVEISRAEDKAS